MRVMMLLYGQERDWHGADPDRVAAAMREIETWTSRWAEAGKLSDGGELEPVRAARTIRPGTAGSDPLVTDGPFLELKEVIGGYVVLEVEDLDEAVAIARTWPGIASHGDVVELRPVTP